jgi:hypothetical protein
MSEISEQFINDKEIEELKALLVLKDGQILAMAQKIDKIVKYLQSKDYDENDEKIELHELDEDGEYDKKVINWLTMKIL